MKDRRYLLLVACGVDYARRLIDVDGERFFGHDVTAGLQALHRQRRVRVVRGDDDAHLGVAFGEQVIDLVVSVHRVAKIGFGGGGTLFIEKAPLFVRQQVDAWGEVGAGERLMKAVKEKFDPQGILNPGRFVAGI